jgi:hypothetical protein
MAFGEDYQRPTAPEKARNSHGGSPSGYLTDGFGHRQVIHILLSLQALITKVRNLAGQDPERSKASTGPVTFPKSVYPDNTGASMTRSIDDQPRVNNPGAY